MSIKSMTGYGQGSAQSALGEATIEISSVNRKHLDLRFECEKSLTFLEPMVMDTVKKRISRGALTCRAKFIPSDSRETEFRLIDDKLAGQYAGELKALATRLGLSHDIGTGALALLPGVIRQEKNILPAKETWNVFAQALKTALDDLITMRATEGKQLAKDLSKRLQLLSKWSEKIEKLSANAAKQQAKRLKARISELGIDMPVDDDRLCKEVAFLADRTDISEEITRLRSHIKQFTALLESNKAAGRTMEFLAQELLRESNTIGSKASDKRISALVIKCKSEIERIREQVLNIE